MAERKLFNAKNWMTGSYTGVTLEKEGIRTIVSQLRKAIRPKLGLIELHAGWHACKSKLERAYRKEFPCSAGGGNRRFEEIPTMSRNSNS